MYTTVRVRRDTKKRLDKLQGSLQADTGKRVSHDALLQRLASLAERHQASLTAEPDANDFAFDDWLRAVESQPTHGPTTNARRYKKELYGGKHP